MKHDTVLIYIFSLQQSPDSTMLSQPTPPKNQRLVPNPANNNAGSKISLNHYLKRLHSKNTDEYDEVFERNKVDVPLPLPAPDELFQGTESNSISYFLVYFFEQSFTILKALALVCRCTFLFCFI